MNESIQFKSSGYKFAIIRSAFVKICADETFRRRVWKKWLPAETWAEALGASGLIDAGVHLIDVKSFNAAMIRSKLDFNGHLMERFDGTNNSGVFRVTFQRKWYYFVTDPNTQAAYPSPLDINWKERVHLNAKNVLTTQSTRASASAPSILSLLSCQDNNASDVTLPETASNKRQRTCNQQEVVDSLDMDVIVADESVNCQADMFSYWDSREAYNLFGQNAHAVEGHNTKDTLEHHIKNLQSVSKDQNGWRNVVEGRDPDNLCTALDIFMLRGRAIILCFAYQTAIAQMNKWTWQQCCTEACQQLNQLGLVQATHCRTVQDWNVEFRKRGTFLHPNHIVRCGKRPSPLLFLRFPKAEEKITAFGLSNLTTLTVELMHSFCLEKLIPELFKQWCDDMEHCRIEEGITDSRLNHEPLSQEMFLLEHGIRNFSIPTCWRWLHRLGFSYNTQRKGYYVDGHERSDVIACREQFCSDYLTKLEPRCLRWVQFTASELATTRNSILNPAFGHSYIDSKGEMCYEFHVDYCYSFDMANENSIMDGKVATMSIRVPKPSRPIEIYGQDESVFSQYIFPPKSWVGPNQQRGLLPKSLGEGLMISAFVSRDTGFGMPISDENLAAINAIRHGKEYIDKTAALEVYKSTRKPPLTKSPFVRHLLIGATKGGYWNSFHMAVQLEDAVDCLNYLRPQFDFVFLFDHSQGHARKKDGALDANGMSRSFGGVQPKMRCSKIEAGCLGPFSSILSIGDEQSMTFKDGDRGPWWLVSNELCDKRKHDTPDTDGRSKIVQRTRTELAKALFEEAGITVEPNRPLNELKEISIRHGLSLTRQKLFITEGWVGKPKGLLQVLWERGWIDESQCKQSTDKEGYKILNTSCYTLNGKKNPITGNLDESMSLRNAIAKCTDFIQEETALQHLGSQLGLKVMLTPKFHCEFAGEGIEYNWAHAKAKMRRTPIREKKGRANFMNLVMKCLCPESVLTKERIRKFASRARAYICTYYYLSQVVGAGNNGTNNHNNSHVDANAPGYFASVPEKQQLLFKEIEKLMKNFRTHRCALDFDTRFVQAALREEEEEDAV